MTTSHRALFFTSLLLSACSSPSPCAGIVCGACPETFVVRVTLEGGGTEAEIDGVPCVADGAELVCSTSPGVGSRTVLIEAPGYVTSTQMVVIGAPAEGCCTCSPQVTRSVTLTPESATDDAGTSDAGTSDAGTSDASDVGDSGMPECDESRIDLPPGGRLEVGQLCDDVFACATSSDDAARIMAAVPALECSDTPEGPCTGITCVLRPSVLDEQELAQVCALTTLDSPPPLFCRVYL